VTTSFDALGVAADLAGALAAAGKTHAFAIQELTIADALAGRDVWARG
jgi:superfamily II DNA/RNA helicase